jgi:hypothetical protein
MEPEGSLLCSQEPASGSYPEPDESIPHAYTHFLKIYFNILPSMPRSSKCVFPSIFPNDK